MIERLTADATCLKGALRTLKMTTPIAKNPTRVFPQVITELAEKYGDAPALLSDRERFSYRELAARSNRYARWALAQGLRKGDTVCLLMQGRPEFLALWIGLTRVGGVVALLNTNLTGTALAHCINVVSPRHIIVAADLLEALASARPHVTGDAKTWLHGDAAADLPRIDRMVDALPGDELAPSERRVLTIEDRALYIYTSGTTGMPKAANVNHYRLMLASLGFAGVMGTRASDRMYDCLPMYHTTGGVVATGALLVKGGSVVIREKFSASAFWDDVARHDCTMFQYIGELCRYLVNAPPSANETHHRLRLCCGNGLRPDIWPAFQARFRIPRIVEFYAATEGNVTLFNFEGKPGAIGRVPRLLDRRFPVRIVKFDIGQEAPLRDERGFCIRCAPGEAGETIGRIVNDPSAPSNRFEGYADPQDSERKILRNVFAAGDAWFRTGDLMRQDARGYFYFVDRIGDTFRWKGENVSTAEVAETINRFPGIRDANVYGVEVSGRDGRAGMAAIVADDNLDFAGLRAHLHALLPDYARPLFLRVCGELAVTMTFKQKKLDLVGQGFDPATTADVIYFDDPRTGAFVRIDAARYAQIVSGAVRL
jgi:fatty-acyl-CoA synthase